MPLFSPNQSELQEYGGCVLRYIRASVAERIVSWPLLRYCSQHASQAMPIDCLLLVLPNRGTDAMAHNAMAQAAKQSWPALENTSFRKDTESENRHKLYLGEILRSSRTCTPAEGTVPLVPLFVALEYTNIECRYVQ